jgi:hypothetical protein
MDHLLLLHGGLLVLLHLVDRDCPFGDGAPLARCDRVASRKEATATAAASSAALERRPIGSWRSAPTASAQPKSRLVQRPRERGIPLVGRPLLDWIHLTIGKARRPGRVTCYNSFQLPASSSTRAGTLRFLAETRQRQASRVQQPQRSADAGCQPQHFSHFWTWPPITVGAQSSRAVRLGEHTLAKSPDVHGDCVPLIV